MPQPISNLSVKAKVKSPDTKYNGVPIIWLIGHKETGRVKLVTERIITLKCIDAKEASNPDSSRQRYGNNRYSVSNIDQWLNSAAAGAWYSKRHDYDAHQQTRTFIRIITNTTLKLVFFLISKKPSGMLFLIPQSGL